MANLGVRSLVSRTSVLALLAVIALACPSFGEKPDKITILAGKLSDKRLCVSTRAARLLGATKSSRAIKPLVAALGSTELDLRFAAVDALAEIGDTRAVKPLIGALKDPQLSASAASALGRLRARKAVGPLTSLLAGGAPYGEAVVEALGMIGDPSAAGPILDYVARKQCCRDEVLTTALASMDPPPIGLLTGELSSADPILRGSAALCLSAIGNPSATEPVIALLNDEDGEIRNLAAECLGEMKDPRALEALATVAQDSRRDTELRAAAALAYGAAMPEGASSVLLPLLDEPDEALSTGAAEGLARSGDTEGIRILVQRALDHSLPEGASLAVASMSYLKGESLRPLLEMLHDPDDAVRRIVVSALSTLSSDGPEVIPTLLAIAKDPDLEVRRHVISGLARAARAKDERVLAALIASAADADNEIRADAIEAIGDWEAPSARAALAAATKDADPDIRSSALSLLPRVGNARVILPLLKDAVPTVRREAATALGWTGEKSAVDPLAEALNDADAAVRLAAACSLVKLGDYRALNRVVEALGSSNADSATTAATCLREIKDTQAIEPLRQYLDRRHAHDLILLAMARSGDHASVLEAARMLSSRPRKTTPPGAPGSQEMMGPEPTTAVTQYDIVSALGESRDRSATKPLLDSPCLEDEFSSFDGLASALAQLGDPAAAGAVIKLLDVDDDDVRWNAAWVLAQIDCEESSAALMAGLKEWDTAVVGAGAHFFIRRGIDAAVPVLVDAMLVMDDWNQDMDLVEGSLASGKHELISAARKCARADWCWPLDGVPDWGGRYCTWAEDRAAHPATPAE